MDGWMDGWMDIIRFAPLSSRARTNASNLVTERNAYYRRYKEATVGSAVISAVMKADDD
jgi:hypothetical protein